MTSNKFNILDDVIKLSEYKNTEKIADYISYNTIGGKAIRSVLFNLISEGNSRESVLTSNMIELLQASLIVIDDIMDNSNYRREQLCYYKKQGMISLKYSAYFLGVISKLISQKCTEIYFNALFNTFLGQTLDCKEKREDDYTEKMYNNVAEYKTSIYTFYLPLSAGYSYMNKEEPKNLYEFASTIGIIFQMQDDYLNFHPKKSKKTGNDLEEMKLTYFTCRLYTEKNDEYVKEYFKTGKVNDYILEKVQSYFPDYQKKVDEYMKKAEELAKTFDLNILNFIYKLLKKND